MPLNYILKHKNYCQDRKYRRPKSVNHSIEKYHLQKKSFFLAYNKKYLLH